MHLFSLEGKLFGLLVATVSVAVISTITLAYWVDTLWSAGAFALLMLVTLALFTASLLIRPIKHLLRALSGSVIGFRDGDFSFSIRVNRRDELGALVQVHNELGRVLREERQNLFQRELLLETMVQHTSTALVLVDSADRVVHANLAAQQLLHAGQRMIGLSFPQVISECPAPLTQAVAKGEDCLFTVMLQQAEETFHLSCRKFKLQGRNHQLYLLKRMTRELSRQEVQIWKKVIRVISHELNNSLAPISSLAHSGRELLRKNDFTRMIQVFDTIEERAHHLDGFIQGYAEFAKLPQPQPEEIAWRPFLDGMVRHYKFREIWPIPQKPSWFDRIQLEQALINLLKNAHESGSAPETIELSVQLSDNETHIEVRDQGPGMSEMVLANALLPFYSTKRDGSGLGLALTREIVEAHGGRIALRNHEGGGLTVSITLPNKANA